MRTEWSNKDSLEMPEITAGYGSVSWSDYKTGTSCDSVVLPIIEAELVRHGHWIEHHEPFTWMGYTTWTCSKCNYECGYEKKIGLKTSYCPNCGAKMDRKGEEDDGI